MKKAEIVAKINEFIPVKEKQIVEKSIDVNGLSFVNLRNRLIGLGKILEENLDNNYYVVNIPAGFANKNAAVILIIWSAEKLSLFAYSKEGLINQHTVDEAIEKVIIELFRKKR